MSVLGDFLGLPLGVTKKERILQARFPCHNGYNAGRTHIPDTVQRGCIQHHHNLAGYDDIIPAGGSGWTGRYHWTLCGSLLYRQWNGRIEKSGLAVSHNEHPC